MGGRWFSFLWSFLVDFLYVYPVPLSSTDTPRKPISQRWIRMGCSYCSNVLGPLCSVLPLTWAFLLTLARVDLALCLKSPVFSSPWEQIELLGLFRRHWWIFQPQTSPPAGPTLAPLPEKIRWFHCIVKTRPKASVRKLLGLCNQWLWKPRSCPLPGCKAAEHAWQKLRASRAWPSRWWGQTRAGSPASPLCSVEPVRSPSSGCAGRTTSKGYWKH